MKPLPWILCLSLVCLPFTGCTSSQERTRRAILRIGQADKELSQQLRSLPQNTTPSQLAWSIGQYCDAAERLDMSDCPADFSVAYKQHVRAWRDTQLAFQQLPDGFVDGVLMGAMNSLLRGETDGGQNRLFGQLNHSHERVKATWENVETVAAKYGAEL